ncbi:MAG TPA: GGDEF domain-containing protein [Trueperaceae bacterium]|nr:GGDEF domain-containing protein [Trueperaceae bacterium]
MTSADRFRWILWRVVIGGFAAHAAFAVVFVLLGLGGMAWHTAAGLVMPSLAYALLRRGTANVALAVICIDIAVASALGAVYLGEASGFLYYMMVPLVLIGLHPGRSPTRWAWMGLLGTLYIGFELLWPALGGLAGVPAGTVHVVHVFNVLVVSVAVVVMALLSAYSVARAEHAQRSAMRVMEGIALRDGLTDLLNRRAVEEELARENSRSQRSARFYCVVMGDVDRFKAVNDRYGHAAGDAVLRAVAGLLRGSMRDHDVVSRWGGEEFVLVLPETSLAGGLRTAEKLRASVEDLAIDAEGETLHVTMTFGVAEGDGESPPSQVVEAADAAMYRGKGEGRNRVVAAGTVATGSAAPVTRSA